MKGNSTNKTTFVWIIIGLVIINSLFLLHAIISQIFNIFKYDGSLTLLYIGVILNIILLITSIYYLIKLYKVKKELFYWTNIVFGLDLIILVFGLIGTFVNLSNQQFAESKLIAFALSSIFFGIPIIIEVLLWIFFYKHLKKAEKLKLMKFT